MRDHINVERYLLIAVAIALGVLAFSALRGLSLSAELRALRADHEWTHERIRKLHERFREQGTNCRACHETVEPTP